MRISRACALALALLASGCAAPPVTLYTLGAPAVAAGTSGNPADAPTLEVRRITLPDYLDTQDLLTRDGAVIARSSKGRWASRLSLGATDLITARLAAARPDLFVTDQPPIQPAALRLFVNISRLDVSTSGQAALAADWTIEPRQDGRPDLRDRASLTATGPVKIDADVVALTNSLLDQLSARIAADLARVTPGGS